MELKAKNNFILNLEINQYALGKTHRLTDEDTPMPSIHTSLPTISPLTEKTAIVPADDSYLSSVKFVCARHICILAMVMKVIN